MSIEIYQIFGGLEILIILVLLLMFLKEYPKLR